MKISNQDLKELKAIADKLPAMTSTTVEKRVLRGSDIIKHKLAEEIDGKPVDPKLVYQMNRPVQTPINHFRRLKKQYESYGESGVRKYIDAVKKLQEKQTA